MNLTTTRAAKPASAEPNIASRWLYLNTINTPNSGAQVHEHGSCPHQATSERSVVVSEHESFGMVLLGIGYDSSVE